MEVLVSFINGDPDRPIITGCLFNGHNHVPYALPEHKTRSTFKTASSPGGGNSNELRYEDKAGSEEIYLHAAKDYQEHIEHNSHSHIVNDRQQLIEGQFISDVRGEHHHTVHGTSHWHAKADEHHTIDGSRHTNIGNKELIEAGQELHYHAGNKIVINAGKTLTATGGGSFLKLDASGVTLVGPTVKINSGGSAGKGSGAAALLSQILAVSKSRRAGKGTMQLQPQSTPLNQLLTSSKIGTNAHVNSLIEGQNTDSDTADISFRFVTTLGKPLKQVPYHVSTDASNTPADKPSGTTTKDGSTGVVSTTLNETVTVNVMWPKYVVEEKVEEKKEQKSWLPDWF